MQKEGIMWKLIIADDEPRIREGLKETIQDFDLDIEICGLAKNGLVALEMVKELKPHIVLADISMPKLNGIDLIRRIKEEYLGVEIIIITGHDEFDYARKAIHLGVLEYLLKPINEKELYNTLKALINKFSQETQDIRFKFLMNEQLQKNKEHLRETFFNSWIEEEIAYDEVEEQMKVLAVDYPKEAAIVFLSAPYGTIIQNAGSGLTENLVKHTLEQVMKEFFQARTTAYVFSDKHRNIIALVECEKMELEKLLTSCRSEIGVLVHGKCRIEGDICTKGTFVIVYHLLKERITNELAQNPIVKKAKAYIIEHFNKNELDLIVVANNIGCNPSYLSRLMKEEIGLSFKEFLKSLRIQKAIELMKDPEETINDVAEKVGYSNQHYFSTAFKRITGMSPSEYRKI